MWEEITGPDGIVRQMQWTARVEGSNGEPNGSKSNLFTHTLHFLTAADTMTLSLYLGRGQLSRGRTTIQKGLNMVVSTLPYGNTNDLAAVATAIDHMVAALNLVPGLTWLLPPKGTSGAAYLASVSRLTPYFTHSADNLHRCPSHTPISAPAAQTTGSALRKWEPTAA
jgi:cellobiose dehydrogenase (acceptor)